MPPPPGWAFGRSHAHPNPSFRPSPRDRNRARARGVLTVNGPCGPLAARMPFLLDDDASFAESHLARSNLMARADLSAPALIAVSGRDACISPDWYGPHAGSRSGPDLELRRRPPARDARNLARRRAAAPCRCAFL
ncbi:MAG: FMN-binding negative transcriptional regulator [Tabrizicola sp.]